MSFILKKKKKKKKSKERDWGWLLHGKSEDRE